MNADEGIREVAPPPWPVRRHHVPGWLRSRLLRRFGAPQEAPRTGYEVLLHAIALIIAKINTNSGRYFSDSDWLDNWGSSRIDGVVCFVAEPHMLWPPRRPRLVVPHLLAVATDCRLLVLPRAAMSTNGVIRLQFVPNDEELQASEKES
jgi:hypothetical protein